MLKGTLLWGHEVRRAVALVDSGADNSLIDTENAKQAGLLLVALKQPRRVNGVNGRALAIVRYCNRYLYQEHHDLVEVFSMEPITAAAQTI